MMIYVIKYYSFEGNLTLKTSARILVVRYHTRWDARLCSGFGTVNRNIMVKKKLIEIKLGFWDNLRKHNVKNLSLGFGTISGNIMVKNM